MSASPPAPSDLHPVREADETRPLPEKSPAGHLRSEEFEALINLVPMGIFVVDADLRVYEINPVARPVFDGIPDIIGRDFDEVIHIVWPKEFADEVVRIFRRAIETGTSFVETRTVEERADRRVTEAYEWRVERIRLADGRHGAACFFRDVSERVRAEQAQQRLASIVESSDDAIISKNLDGTVTSWNKGAERVFGYTAEEMIGKPIHTLIPSDRQNEEPDIIARIRAGERVDHYETVRRRKDGTLIDISLTISPVRDASGTIVGASKIARDISLRKQAESTRQLLLNELNHRVKNTLANVQAIVQQTLSSTKDPVDFAQRFSGRIQSMARVHSLLTETTWQGADLRELIRDQLLQGSVDETRLTAWGPAVHLGPQTTLHLALMLHELGTNSVKHGALSVNGGWVTVSWSVRGIMLHLQWEERGGPAVAAPVRRGFGMTLIEQSAKSEGGYARMALEAKGVTWEIVLPLPEASAAKPARRPPDAEMITPSDRQDAALFAPRAILAGQRFLIIEDEPIIALGLVSSLEMAGAESVRSAGTEKEALDVIEYGDFDAALLDANLHGRPVDEVAAALTRRSIPFVFVTGYGREALPTAFKKASILAKPFSDQQLIDTAESLVKRKSSVVQLKG